MSTIKLTFQTQALDFSPLTRGSVTIIHNDGNMDIPLTLTLDSISVYKRFLEVAWVDGMSEEDEDQANNYRLSFNRDYKDVGGVKNLGATVDGNEVTITAKTGTFSAGSSYSGNVLIVNGFTIDNTTTVLNPIITANLTGNGDCTNVEHSLTATEGTSPYILKQGTTVIDAAWDGTEELVDVTRESGQVSFSVTDSNGLVTSKTVIVPRKLKPGEFKQRITQGIGSSDVLIESVNPVSNTEPIEYSLDVQGTLTGGNYQSSNVFAGVLPGFYELFIKDKYDCEVTKTIQVTSYQDATEEQNPRYFDVPKGNSIIMSECVAFDKDIRPNYNNTLSLSELSDINYRVVQYFDPTDFEPIQFKSSYPYHVATLHKSNGTKQDLSIVLVQENLGSKEKVDCELFPLDGRTAVYFDGGNEYEPDTTTVIGASDYTQFLPSWAVEGQLVTIDGLGVNEIVELGYDSTLQRGYFVIDVYTASSTSGLVQVVWNIQDYNVFEVYVPFDNMVRGRVTIEKGFSFSEIDGNKWISELLEAKEVEKDDLLIEWSSTKNQSDIVFFSGVKFKKRIKGKFRPIFPNSSEISEGDSRAYSLDQELYQHYRLELQKLSAREIHQILIASKTDGFKVNGENLIKKQDVEPEILGESNMYSFTCDYAYGGNNAAVQPDSLALNSSTGVVGGGGTGKPGAPPTYDDKLRVNIGGGFITVSEDFISVDE
ncbi:hypothetical protein J0X14_14205 [Muricauda sp. CAU 1633]|uniref:hypothetical protein n=1 Tax=Allomuricauda sp. CAU 1633 TaxID=2816036 RepID=UPI001A8FCAD3|nr:hypothetical protein [Muricauda sp. CAU 1633]MBO0323457.1 hypothetical protein [Muricauda sp. CAU 1633]